MYQTLPVNKACFFYSFIAIIYVFSIPFAPYPLSPFVKASPILLLLTLCFLTLVGKQRILTVAALGFSALGDVFLAMEFENNFIAGLGAFLTAHVFYTLVFLPFTNTRNITRKLALCASVILYCTLLATQILPQDPMLKTAVVTYIIVLSVMCFAAVFAAKRKFSLQMAGALIFAVSDSIIAWDAFRQPLPWASIWIMVTYYLAQAMIIFGILRLVEKDHLRN